MAPHRLIIALLSICACILLSSTARAQEENNVDPWESLNRKIFVFNDVSDRYVLKPLARTYQFLVPQFIDNGISNMFDNLGEVVTFLNDILQFKPKEAAVSSGRLLINSTVGLFGFFEVAGKIGLQRNKEDFGQTFARWGVSSGPYLVLPLLGPSTVRDAVGLIPDTYAHPSMYANDTGFRNTSYVVDKIDARADLLKAEEAIFGDRYTFIKDAYLQHREYLIMDGEVEDDFGEEDFDEEFEE